MVPAMASPNVPPRLRMKLRVDYFESVSSGTCARCTDMSYRDDRHVLAFDSGLDGDQAWLQRVSQSKSGKKRVSYLLPKRGTVKCRK
jgi:hypothetical protein